MERKTNISSALFFLMMFVSRVVVTIALNAQYLGGENMVDSIAAYLLSMVLGFFIALPIWILNRKYPYLNVGDVAKLALGKAGKLVPVCYILYFVLTNGASLALFEIFLLDTVNPDFSSILVLLAIVGVALYGAFRGIETISRCATCVVAVLLLGVALVFGIVLFRFRTENLEPLFAGGLEQTARSVMLFVARTSIFADMAVLLPMVRGKKALGFSLWSVGTAAFVSALLLLLAGCLGRYAATQNVPGYVLASITEVRSLQRLDAVFIGVWMMGVVTKLACDVYACRVCFSSLTRKKEPRWASFGAALLMLGTAFFAVRSFSMQKVALNTSILFLTTLFTGFLLPALVLLADWLKNRRKEGKDSE